MTDANPYKLRIPDELASFIRKLHPRIKKHVRYAFETILEDPYSGKALKDELEGLRTFRIKRYRVIYRINKKCSELEIVALGPRKNIYEDTFRIISK
ncbi:MAG: type II toxin-antitoxin system RelE/ParE family toxin [Proteobacteria bacterium]|nr:type II toxin-antitoxin system RelE/ParE family toxin [Pseudomonadota bacterium]MBU1709351.1 type II toxin-antitoxin system RelE/ParE family toxin [Pseudomonadota bacterium]